MLGKGVCQFSLPYVDVLAVCWPTGMLYVIFVFFPWPALEYIFY
jgi:hypothetical protein